MGLPSPLPDSPIRKSVDVTRASSSAKVYSLPVSEEFLFEITIKILQTSRNQRNKLSLSRETLETVIGEVSNLTFLQNNTNILSEDISGTGCFISAIGLLRLLCYHLSKIYYKVTSTKTSGIWDVSECNSLCCILFFIINCIFYFLIFYFIINRLTSLPDLCMVQRKKIQREFS